VAASERTESVAEDRQAGVFTGPDLVTALRVRGAEYELVMLAGKSRFTFGTSPECDLEVHDRRVSHSHALLERKDNRVRVTDLHSKNGLNFRGRREAQFDVYAGDRFSVDDLVFYALNDEMRLQRPVMAEILGADRAVDADDLVIAAMQGGPVIIHAEPGCDQERLSRALHSASLRRRHHFVVAAPGADGAAPGAHLAERAHLGTLFVPLAGTATADAAFIEALRRPEINVRVIACAASATTCSGLRFVPASHLSAIGPVRSPASSSGGSSTAARNGGSRT
jgi:Inner membrane component of T3SS, cytoplasmic domain